MMSTIFGPAHFITFHRATCHLALLIKHGTWQLQVILMGGLTAVYAHATHIYVSVLYITPMYNGV
jgi:hypothetical protein